MCIAKELGRLEFPPISRTLEAAHYSRLAPPGCRGRARAATTTEIHRPRVGTLVCRSDGDAGHQLLLALLELLEADAFFGVGVVQLFDETKQLVGRDVALT